MWILGTSMKTHDEDFDGELDDDETENTDDEALELEAWEEDSEAEGSDGHHAQDATGNGYGSLVRLGRSRGWVTVEDINDHLPESAVRTAEICRKLPKRWHASRFAFLKRRQMKMICCSLVTKPMTVKILTTMMQQRC